MLTQQQLVAAAAGMLLLALDEPELPTISSMAKGLEHEGAGGTKEAEKIIHGHVIQLHVKTPQGEEFYHLPIGSLIVKHFGAIHGEHSKMVHAGEHSFAVPKKAKVFVPKDTDLDDEHEVKNAVKRIVVHSPKGEERHALVTHKGEINEVDMPHTLGGPPASLALQHQHIKANWKELPEGKKPVNFNGKTAAWVPHDWDIHVPKGASEAQIGSKWAKDSEGKWHVIGKDGKIAHDETAGELAGGGHVPVLTNTGNKYAAEGKIVPEHGGADVHAPSHPEHVEPAPSHPHTAAAAKLEVKGHGGNIPVTKEQIQDALDILAKDKSTAVKQPLAKAGHPLAAMDYHAITKEILKDHPELKVEKGSKQAHIGQVKHVINWHLADLLKQGVPQTKAETQVIQHVQEKAVAQAHHAQELTPAKHAIGGVSASKEEIQAAIDKLESTQATSIKQPLAAIGNALKDTDYWSVVHGHQAQFPNEMSGLKAKPVFIAALKHHLEQLGKEDTESGHEQAVAVHKLIDEGVPKAAAAAEHGPVPAPKPEVPKPEAPKLEAPVLQPPKPPEAPKPVVPEVKPEVPKPSLHEKKWKDAIASGLKQAHEHQTDYYVHGVPGSWDVQPGHPGHDDWWKTGADHSIAYHKPGGKTGFYNQEKAAALVNEVFKQQEGAEPAAVKLPAEKIAEPEVPPDITADKDWPELHQLVMNSKPVSYTGPENNSDKPTAWAMQTAHKQESVWHVVQQPGGQWYPTQETPSKGSLGAPGDTFFTVSPDHQLSFTNAYGNTIHEPAHVIKSFAQANFDQEEEPLAAHPEDWETALLKSTEQIPVKVHGEEVGKAEPGSKLYWNSGWAQSADEANNVYVKKPDGSWAVFGKNGELAPGLGKNYDQLISTGKFQETGVPGEEKLPETKPVMIHGVHAADVPAGSKVYWYSGGSHFAKENEVGVKYVQHADGNWKVIQPTGMHDGMTGGYDDYVNDGTFTPSGGLPHTPDDVPIKEADADTPVPELPEPFVPGDNVPIVMQGKTVASVPKGSKIWYKGWNNGVPQSEATAKDKWVLTPSGDWKVFGLDGEGTVPKYNNYNYYIKEGKDKEYVLAGTAPISDEDLAKTVALAAHLKNAAIAPEDGSLGNALAHAAKTATKDSDHEGIVRQIGTTYEHVTHTYSKGTYYKVRIKSGKVELWKGIKETGGYSDEPKFGKEPDAQQVFDAVGEHATPDAVLIGKEGEQKIYKGGFYYTPGNKSKTFLEIKTDATPKHWKGSYQQKQKGASFEAKYIWHKSDGSMEEISPLSAMGKLQTSTEYQAEPKQGFEAALSSVKHVHYAAMAEPGTYKVWSSVAKAPDAHSSYEIKDDGSAVYSGPSGDSPTQAAHTEALLKGGALLDQHSNTVVRPGIQPDSYHLFGADSRTPEQLKAALDAIDEAQGTSSAWVEAFKAHFPEYLAEAKPGETLNPFRQAVKSFFTEKGVSGGQEQRAATSGLMREMLLVPKAKEITAEPKEITYLKGLPPGINSPKDIFKWATSGTVQPTGPLVSHYEPGGNYIKALSDFSSPELAQQIKDISEHYGGGKVVGTHSASLSKDQRIAWLTAWRNGDMKSVFNLDASGGKVSTVHPGAPEHVSTNSITWTPWNPAEVPANVSYPVTGASWTPLDQGITLPKAEIANYVIKAGLEHSEHLSPSELRNWVTSHRKGNQDIVNHLSQVASQRYKSGQAKLSDTPVWTANIKPAKSYDIFVEEKKPASEWTHQAVSSFVKDNYAKLEPYNDTGYSKDALSESGYWSDAHSLIQKYQDGEQAKWEHEQSKPVWSVTQGAAKPTSSHPIQQITQTIPLTGKQSQWFFKPSPPIQAGQSPQYRPEVAQAAFEAAKAFGFRTPEQHLITFKGKYGTVQRKLPGGEDLVGGKQLGVSEAPKIPWESYTTRQLQDVAKEHVLDWALDNQDGRAANLLHQPDGSIIGIDKEHAWRNFGQWNGVTGTEKSDGFSKLVATQLYNAVRNHQVSKQDADKTYVSVIQTARRMGQVPDARMQAILEKGFANRTNFNEFGNGDKGRAAYIKAIIARKNGLEGDFEKLWTGVYKDAGWSKPEVPKEALSHGLHSGFSEPTFFDHVMAGKSYGVPAFFAGPHLNEGHVHVWTEVAGENRYVRGEAQVRGHALDAISNWADQHLDKDVPVNLKSSVAPAGIPGKGLIGAGVAVKGEPDWFSKVAGASKAVAKHAQDQVWSGAWTQQKLSDMAALKQELSSHLTTAEHVLGQGADHPAWGQLTASTGSPEMVASAAKHYLDQIKKLEDAKAGGIITHSADFPRWVPPKNVPIGGKTPEIAKQDAGIKVELRTATRILSEHDKQGDSKGPMKSLGDDGELHLGDNIFSYKGKAWHITLPTGEVIEVNDEDKTNTSPGQVGRIRFRAVASDGSASLERIRAQLQSMGLPMEEAQQHDMELHYWRHLAFEMANRHDGTSGNRQKVWDSLKQQMTDRKLEWSSTGKMSKNVATLANSTVSPDDEVGMWRSAFAHLTTPDQVDEFAKAQRYLPFMNHYDVTAPQVPNGKPLWYRFDMMADPKFLGEKQMLQHSFKYPDIDPERVSSSGGLFSTETRLRTLGVFINGKSSATDMNEKGSGGFIFTHPGSETLGNGVLLSPRTLARTTNYAYSGDHFGDIADKITSAAFDADSSTKDSLHEFMIPDGASLLDDVELLKAYSQQQRMKIIQQLKDNGIMSIRGLPVEDRVVTSLSPDAIAKARSVYKDDPLGHFFSHPAENYVPPVAEAVSAEKSATETAAEIAAAEEGGTKVLTPADVAGDVSFSADHTMGAPEADVSQVFYKQPSFPPSASSQGPKIKSDSAERVAKEMTSTSDQVKALYKDANLQASPSWNKDNEKAQMVAGMIAAHSHGNSSPFILAMQDATRKLFNTQKEPLPHLTPSAQENQAKADELMAKHGDVLQDFVRSQWQGVQDDLSKEGVSHVTLYRVFHFNGGEPDWAKNSAGTVIEAPQQRPFSQWSYREQGALTAGTFGGGGHTVLVKATVPKEQIIAYPRSGIGCYHESEFVVADAPGQWEITKS